jgi:hypothetical protein
MQGEWAVVREMVSDRKYVINFIAYVIGVEC